MSQEYEDELFKEIMMLENEAKALFAKISQSLGPEWARRVYKELAKQSLGRKRTSAQQGYNRLMLSLHRQGVSIAEIARFMVRERLDPIDGTKVRWAHSEGGVKKQMERLLKERDKTLTSSAAQRARDHRDI